MKKLMRKLVLSSFALGLAVITLSTTTFAWYTANTNVTASGVQSSTSAAGSALLMITQYKAGTTEVNKGPGQLLDWQTAIDTVTMDVSGELIPLERVDSQNSLNERGKTGHLNTGKGFIEFTLCFKNAGSGNLPIYISKFDIKNTTDVDTVTANQQLPTKDIISAGRVDGAMGTYGTQKNAAPGATNEEIAAAPYMNYTYTIDVLRTLMVTTNSVQYLTTAGTTAASAASRAYNIYNLDGIVTPLATDSFGLNNGLNWNAHKYYNQIMDGTDIPEVENTYSAKNIITSTQKDADDEVLVLATVPTAGDADHRDQYVEVTFRIFINGWDLACFDACKEQTITVDLAFTTEMNETKSNILYLQ